MKLCFIGGGNMATALIGGLITRGQSASAIHVIDPAEPQRNRLEAQFGVSTSATASKQAIDETVIVLAVKPQQMHEVATTLAPLLTGQLVISIAAGIRGSDLSRWLGGHQRMVRTMPNTPALIGAGITAAAAADGLTEQDRRLTQTILEAVGECVWVDHEQQLDAVTAVSGSGPAYVFYFMEAMQQGACALGLSESQARQLTLATFVGASKLAAQSDESVSVLRERVTSKGGTTAAALATFADQTVAAGIKAGLASACRRSVELGDELGRC